MSCNKKRHSLIPASYLMLMQNEQILLLRRYNTGYADGLYSFIAGHVEPCENFTDAIIREAGEEAGIILNRSDLFAAHIMHRTGCPLSINPNARMDIFFTAKKWQGEIINQEPHKCDDLSWFNINALPTNIIPYIRHAISCITAGLRFSEYAN